MARLRAPARRFSSARPDGRSFALLGIREDRRSSFLRGPALAPPLLREALRSESANSFSELGVEVPPMHDAGDLVEPSRAAVDERVRALLDRGQTPLVLGGDHSLTFPVFEALASWRHGTAGAADRPLCLVHFDAHLDTWGDYMGAPLTHGTPFRRASEEGLFIPQKSVHVGIRGPIPDADDLVEDEGMGFKIIACRDIEEFGIKGIVSRIRQQIGDTPVYLSIDIDVLDPS